MSRGSPSEGQVEGRGRLSRPIRIALIATLAAAVVVSMLDPDEAAPSTPAAKPARLAAARPSAVPQPAAWPAPLRPTTGAAWEPPPPQALAAWTAFRPPPPPPKPAASAPPAVPPFPYVLIGRIEDGGVTRALMSGPHRTLDAKAGDVIDGQWRVEDVRGDGLDLLWLPGGLRQTLSYRPT